MFHHALDDRLLHAHTASLKRLLAPLGMGAEEPSTVRWSTARSSVRSGLDRSGCGLPARTLVDPHLRRH